MTHKIKLTNKFKKDLKIISRRGYDIVLLDQVITELANGNKLAERYQDHPLGGDWINHRECHITPDWLLIYRIDKDVLVLVLTRTGTHADLF